LIGNQFDDREQCEDGHGGSRAEEVEASLVELDPAEVSGPSHRGWRSEGAQSAYDTNQKCEKQHLSGSHDLLL
jgi:hypothetical protein